MSRLEEPTNEASAMQKEISAIAEQGGGRATKVEQLIQQYCPDGVEYKPLGEVCDIHKGVQFNKTDMKEEGSYPVINGGINPSGYVEVFNEEKETITISQGGASAGYVNFIMTRFWLGAHCYAVKQTQQVLNRYLYHFVKQNERTLQQCQYGAGIPALAKATIINLSIPVPPLPVQEEIVRILDSFTELQAELQAELQKRLQQYNYYRDNLLSFEGRTDVEWKKLGEIATDWYRGAGIKRDEVSEEGIPCIRYGEIHTTYNIWFDECVSHTDENKQPAKKYADYGDILFAITSEDIPFIGNSVAYIGKERILVGGDIVVMKHTQNPKYMSYVLSTSDAVMQKGKGKVKSKVVHTSVPSLKEIVVPIPSLEEQERIATILDKFYALTTDITAGLPAEIEARRKQYEYYRDQLLTFKQKA